jgi:hypothetical protein
MDLRQRTSFARKYMESLVRFRSVFAFLTMVLLWLYGKHFLLAIENTLSEVFVQAAWMGKNLDRITVPNLPVWYVLAPSICYFLGNLTFKRFYTSIYFLVLVVLFFGITAFLPFNWGVLLNLILALGILPLLIGVWLKWVPGIRIFAGFLGGAVILLMEALMADFSLANGQTIYPMVWILLLSTLVAESLTFAFHFKKSKKVQKVSDLIENFQSNQSYYLCLGFLAPLAAYCGQKYSLAFQVHFLLSWLLLFVFVCFLQPVYTLLLPSGYKK